MRRIWNRTLPLLLALTVVVSLLPLPALAADAPDSWAAQEVELAIDLGLVPEDLQNGYTRDITRAEFCRLAVLCLEEAAEVNGWTFTPRSASFDDTSDPDVLTAAGLGIVSGNGKGSFLPDRGITRQEAAVMLYNTLAVMGAPIADAAGGTFTDQSAVADWAAQPVSAVVGWGVMNGTGGGAFSPLASYSRQQAYITMYRLLSSVYMQMESYSYTLQPGESVNTGCYYSTGASTAAWSSSNPSVVAIAADGGDGSATLKAVGPGTASVTCRSGDFQLKCTVTVASASVTTGYDFKGKARTHYSNDMAWDLCRQLESDIGIQIFYLPEFTDGVPGAQVSHATFDYVTLNSAYFQLVYNELVKMKQAFDLYPDGFLKQVVAKKGNRTTEIVLFPADMIFFDGTPVSVMTTGSFTNSGGFAGQHVYDESGMRIDRIYYTGTGSPYHYSHEMGHMVVSSAMIANGWTASCNQWVSYSASSGDFVSSYAMTSRPEDFAETWAYLWHYPDQVAAQLASGQAEGLRSKIRYLYQVLTKHYSSATQASLPWSNLAV